eukprot:Clim_evm106s11 gene=Clim_evmTU106s11
MSMSVRHAFRVHRPVAGAAAGTSIVRHMSTAYPSTDSRQSNPQDQQNKPAPLDGIRVLEMGQLLAGPFGGTVLSYFGAEVIKVEPPGGDQIRTWRLMDETGTSYWYRSIGRNKKSVGLDLRKEEAASIIREMIPKCDVVIENFRPGKMEEWGLGPEDLHAINPDLIYSRVSGYGQTGPRSKIPGYASVCEAYGGFRHVNGYPDRPSVRPNLSIGDTLGGLHSVIGVLLSLLARQQARGTKPRNQVVDVALYESVFNLMEGVITEAAMTGVVRGPSGSSVTGIVPTNTYPCKDAYIVIGANGNAIYKRLMNLMGREDLANDPELQDNGGRMKQQEMLDGTISEWTATMTRAEALALLDSVSVPAGPILDAKDMLADEQFQSRGMFETATASDLGPDVPITLPAILPKLTATPGRTNFAGGPAGEHTDSVLGELLGYDTAKLQSLRDSGVIPAGI